MTLNTQPLSPRKEAGKQAGRELKSNTKTNDLTQQQCPFDDDWELINKLLDEGVGPPEEYTEADGVKTSLSLSPESFLRMTVCARLDHGIMLETKFRAKGAWRGVATPGLGKHVSDENLLND